MDGAKVARGPEEAAGAESKAPPFYHAPVAPPGTLEVVSRPAAVGAELDHDAPRPES